MAHPYASQPEKPPLGCGPGNAVIRAAQYVRMSTENQKFSIENQVTEIRRYADLHGFEVVRTYADAAKSGVWIEGRDALKQLIDDVLKGQTDFTSVLVYDVSRWGRFQDADESAYYEFICKRAGVSVHYCDEPFENDGSINATVFKAMKRAMAAEFSRELSVKIFTVHAHLVSLGFAMGASPGYGLRRLVVDEHGRRLFVLKKGERKNIKSHRIIFIPGPPEEVEVVRRIFKMFVNDGLYESAIANVLNREGIIWAPGKLWDGRFVGRLLTNEKYIGNNIYNRVSIKLRRKLVRNPPDMWIRRNGAFEAIVDVSLFEAAKRIIHNRRNKFSKEQLLAQLRATLAEHGRLTGTMMDARDDIPVKSHNYWTAFGGMANAYKLIGYRPVRDVQWVEHKRHLRSRRQAIIDDVISSIEAVGVSVRPQSGADTLIIGEQLTAVIVVCRQRKGGLAGSRRPLRPFWQIRVDPTTRADIHIVVRLDPSCELILDYYALPPIAVGTHTLLLHKNNGLCFDAYRIDSLERLAHLLKRTPVVDASPEVPVSPIGSEAFQKAASPQLPHIGTEALYRTVSAFSPRLEDKAKRKTTRAAFMLRDYAREAAKQLTLEHQTAVARDSLGVIVNGLRQLSKDEYFVTLLRAEGFHTMPAVLAQRICAGGTHGFDS